MPLELVLQTYLPWVLGAEVRSFGRTCALDYSSPALIPLPSNPRRVPLCLRTRPHPASCLILINLRHRLWFCFPGKETKAQRNSMMSQRPYGSSLVELKPGAGGCFWFCFVFVFMGAAHWAGVFGAIRP